MEAGEVGRGAAMGAFQSSAALARVVGPFIAGALYGLSQAAPFIAAGVVMFTALLLALPIVPRTARLQTGQPANPDVATP